MSSPYFRSTRTRGFGLADTGVVRTFLSCKYDEMIDRTAALGLNVTGINDDVLLEFVEFGTDDEWILSNESKMYQQNCRSSKFV